MLTQMPRGGLFYAALLLALPACERGERSYEITAVRERAATARLDVTGPERFGYGSRLRAKAGGMADSPHGKKTDLKWQLPQGWRDKKSSSSMRTASFEMQGHEKTECYIVFLAGTAGGHLANLNRWCEQVGAAPLDDAGLSALPRIEVLGEPRAVLEAHGAGGDSVLGVVVPAPGRTMFIKLTGPAASVKAQKAAFAEFCKSLVAGG